MHFAAFANSPILAEALLRAKANVDARTTGLYGVRMSPLDVAKKWKRREAQAVLEI